MNTDPSKIPSIVYDKDGNAIDISKLKKDAASIASDSDQDNSPQRVYLARPHEPLKPEISEEVRKKHEESKRKFPYLNLSDGEYIISAVRRHMVGLVRIWAVVGIAILALSAVVIYLGSGAMTGSEYGVGTDSVTWLAFLLIGVMVLLFLGGVAATMVYEGNRFFLTNESVTQHVQLSLFSKREQTISLGNVEDASFSQKGILQTMLNYGKIRLSTQGDETTYRFDYVSDPGRQIALLNDAVESFKNGRPIDPRS